MINSQLLANSCIRYFSCFTYMQILFVKWSGFFPHCNLLWLEAIIWQILLNYSVVTQPSHWQKSNSSSITLTNLRKICKLFNCSQNLTTNCSHRGAILTKIYFDSPLSGNSVTLVCVINIPATCSQMFLWNFKLKGTLLIWRIISSTKLGICS